MKVRREWYLCVYAHSNVLYVDKDGKGNGKVNSIKTRESRRRLLSRARLIKTRILIK